jgi:hypothetical protein
MRVAVGSSKFRLILCLAASLAAGQAHSADASFEGAWLESGSTACEDVFSGAGKATSFKKPVNLFVPAFIVRGSRLRTPQTSCKILRIAPVGDRRRLSLECATPVAVEKTTALLSLSADGALRRYFNEEDSAGSGYKRCSS